MPVFNFRVFNCSSDFSSVHVAVAVNNKSTIIYRLNAPYKNFKN